MSRYTDPCEHSIAHSLWKYSEERKNRDIALNIFLKPSNTLNIEKCVREYEKYSIPCSWSEINATTTYNFQCNDNINMEWGRISDKWLKLTNNPNIYYHTNSIPQSIYNLIDEAKERIRKNTYDRVLSTQMTYLEDSQDEFKKYILNEIKELDKSITLRLKLQTHISCISELIEHPNPQYNIQNDL